MRERSQQEKRREDRRTEEKGKEETAREKTGGEGEPEKITIRYKNKIFYIKNNRSDTVLV